ncbi:hypothetical protein EVJ58_g1983 [Rhodofomes roseus]|uniref:Uncharacterized protein n=1 Tax=Rhodofomes roseus TaxID=34475 RepID=A0A4Y9YWD0_9APHY|nr:hypothetical protein EVJ58_g1983 [Rhodofomes roseus]
MSAVLRVALAVARLGTLEGYWYSPWSIVCFIYFTFIIHVRPPRTVYTVPFPQLPLTAIDPLDATGQESSRSHDHRHARKDAAGKILAVGDEGEEEEEESQGIDSQSQALRSNNLYPWPISRPATELMQTPMRPLGEGGGLRTPTPSTDPLDLFRSALRTPVAGSGVDRHVPVSPSQLGDRSIAEASRVLQSALGLAPSPAPASAPAISSSDDAIDVLTRRVQYLQSPSATRSTRPLPSLDNPLFSTTQHGMSSLAATPSRDPIDLISRRVHRDRGVDVDDSSPVGGEISPEYGTSTHRPPISAAEEATSGSGLLPAIQLPSNPNPQTALSSAIKAVKAVLSRRIPDFVVKVVEVVKYDGVPYERLEVKREKVVLLVEVKLRSSVKTFDHAQRTIAQTLRQQAQEQAVHAFREAADLERIGCIVGVSDLWHYTEYDCTVLDFLPPRNGPDDAYIERSSRRSPIEKYKPSLQGLYTDIEPHFRDLKMLDLDTPQSDRVLGMIVERLRQLSSEYWDE